MNQPHRTEGYRPDIDGLRALAVAAVVVYHAFPTALRGGFVGVDVFFVISGFLISSIIFDRLSAGTFTIGDFYVRRIRRILPALLVVVLLVLGFGYFVLIEDEYAQLGKHVASAMLFISNITLYRESGYFDLSGDTKPLLHLWSLGVEEQFYLIWPLLVAFFWRRRWPVAGLLIGMALLSFAANLLLMRADPSAAFFWPISRFWELMGGAALAHTMRSRKLAGLTHARGALGLGMIAVAVVFFNGRMAFPGWAAVLPVVGTMLVISAGPSAWTNRYLLAARPVVFLGLISYPLYLWHWPLLSYAHIIEDRTPLGTTRLCLLVAAVVLAWLTYVIVEKPLRFGGGVRHKERLLVGGLVAVGVFGLTAYMAPGALNRSAFAPTIAHAGDIGHEEFYGFMQEHYRACEPQELRVATSDWKGVIRCFQSKPGLPTIAILGDSHAEHLLIGAAEANPGENVAYFLRSGPPTLDNPRAKDAVQYALQSQTIQKVVIATWWRGEKPLFTSAQLVETVTALRRAGKDVYLVEDVPWFPFYPQRCKYTGAAFREENKCDELSAPALANQDFYTSALREGEAAGAKIIRTLPLFCSETSCSMAPGGKLMFRDRHHLNINGSRYVGAVLGLSGANP